jgi:hypothetical protein
MNPALAMLFLFLLRLGQPTSRPPADAEALFVKRCESCHAPHGQHDLLTENLKKRYAKISNDKFASTWEDGFVREAMGMHLQLSWWMYPARGTPARPIGETNCPPAWAYAKTQTEWDVVRPELESIIEWIDCMHYPSPQSPFCRSETTR